MTKILTESGYIDQTMVELSQALVEVNDYRKLERLAYEYSRNFTDLGNRSDLDLARYLRAMAAKCKR